VDRNEKLAYLHPAEVQRLGEPSPSLRPLPVEEVIRLTADDDLGFSGMLTAGMAPRQAWEALREQCSDPSVLAALEVLRRSPHGQAVLDRSRQAWAAHGLPPPWEDPGATRAGHRPGEDGPP
jgi:hypothetical protein